MLIYPIMRNYGEINARTRVSGDVCILYMTILTCHLRILWYTWCFQN